MNTQGVVSREAKNARTIVTCAKLIPGNLKIELNVPVFRKERIYARVFLEKIGTARK